MGNVMDFDDFDRYDYIMNDDETPRRKKTSIQPGGCMLVIVVAFGLCVSMLFWVG